MKNKIKVFIYGNKLSVLGKEGGCGHSTEDGGHSCSNKSGGCGNGCTSCGSKEKKSVADMFLELENFIEASDVKSMVDLQFIELEKNKIGWNEEIDDIIDRGFDPPIIVIDGIVRYYGGISNLLVYNDIKELLQ